MILEFVVDVFNNDYIHETEIPPNWHPTTDRSVLEAAGMLPVTSPEYNN